MKGISMLSLYANAIIENYDRNNSLVVSQKAIEKYSNAVIHSIKKIDHLIYTDLCEESEENVKKFFEHVDYVQNGSNSFFKAKDAKAVEDLDLGRYRTLAEMRQ
jgi:hypothetical protein